jgi:hypothetical protein
MINKESVRGLIEDCEVQIENCKNNIIYQYPDDPEQVSAFGRKISNFEFMIRRLQTFL